MDIIEIDENHRLVVEQDTDAENPRKDWDMLTGALTVHASWNTIDVEPVYDFPGDLEYAHRHDSPAVVQRWAKVFYNVTLDYNNGTYWWADRERIRENWPELVPGSPEYVAKERDVIESDQKVYQLWADGEVYGVILEERVQYVRKGAEEQTLERWEVVDSLWGNYLESEEEAKDVARYDFGIELP